MKVTLSHIYKTYPGPTKALVDINFEVDDGEKIYISGASGAGKSTLFNILAGLTVPSSGQAIFNGTELNYDSYTSLSQHRRQVGVIFQDFKLLNDRSIYDNVILPFYASGKKPNSQKVYEVLERLDLKDVSQKQVSALSGGQKQRVAIARTILQDPDLIVADEPTGNLDFEMSCQVMELFFQFEKTVIVATHDQQLIKTYPARTFFIEKGHIAR